MRKVRLLVFVTVAFYGLSWTSHAPAAAQSPANSGALLTKDESKELNAVLTAMEQAGFPDTAKSVAYSGKLAVSATFDPAKGTPPLHFR